MICIKDLQKIYQIIKLNINNQHIMLRNNKPSFGGLGWRCQLSKNMEPHGEV